MISRFKRNIIKVQEQGLEEGKKKQASEIAKRVLEDRVSREFIQIYRSFYSRS